MFAISVLSLFGYHMYLASVNRSTLGNVRYSPMIYIARLRNYLRVVSNLIVVVFIRMCNHILLISCIPVLKLVNE